MEVGTAGHVGMDELGEAVVRWARKNDVEVLLQALTDALCGEL